MADSRTNSYDVIVCETCAQPPQTRGGVLLVPPAANSLPRALLTLSVPDHPIAAAVDPGELLAAPIEPTAAPNPSDVVAQAGDAPAIVAREQDGRRIVELDLALDRETSDVPLSPAFPILIANAIEWLAMNDAHPNQVVAGEPLAWRLTDILRPDQVQINGPDGRTRTARIVGNRLIFTETDVPGAYTVRTPSGEEQFVVNPAVEAESDLETAAGELPTVNAGTARTGEEPLALAPLLLLLACALLAGEAWARSAGLA